MVVAILVRLAKVTQQSNCPFIELTLLFEEPA